MSLWMIIFVLKWSIHINCVDIFSALRTVTMLLISIKIHITRG